MNQERKAKIAAALKPILARYNVKGTLRTRQGAITLTLRSGQVNFVSDMKPVMYGKVVDKVSLMQNYNFMINQYWYQEHYDGEAYHFIKEVNDAMKAANWYDRSDIGTDYFDTAYYYDICVGTFNAPYTVTR
jgi:hypothetical protein